jgi:hypothetical protein
MTRFEASIIRRATTSAIAILKGTGPTPEAELVAKVKAQLAKHPDPELLANLMSALGSVERQLQQLCDDAQRELG